MQQSDLVQSLDHRFAIVGSYIDRIAPSGLPECPERLQQIHVIYRLPFALAKGAPESGGKHDQLLNPLERLQHLDYLVEHFLVGDFYV